MDKAIMFLVESVAISAVLYLLYLALFRGKASYRAQRILLLSIPVVATLLAVVSVDLIPLSGIGAGARVSQSSYIGEQQQVVQESRSVELNSADFKILRGATTTPEVSGLSGEQLEQLEQLEKSEQSNLLIMITEQYPSSMWRYLPMSIWLLVSLLLIVSFVIQLSRILRLRRVTTPLKMEDYTLYRLECDDLIFSFWRGVYVSRSIEGERLEFVMCHELAHIRHRHYIDKLVAELYAMLMWFNPVVRLIQRDLSLVHEYEADHAVVTSGCDVVAYKHFIFDVVASPVPAFSNGFNSSHVKMRFIMMKQDYEVRHRVLRTFATTVTFAAVASFSLVYVQADNVGEEDEMVVETVVNAEGKKYHQVSMSWSESTDQVYVTESDYLDSVLVAKKALIYAISDVKEAMGSVDDIKVISRFIANMHGSRRESDSLLDNPLNRSTIQPKESASTTLNWDYDRVSMTVIDSVATDQISRFIRTYQISHLMELAKIKDDYSKKKFHSDLFRVILWRTCSPSQRTRLHQSAEYLEAERKAEKQLESNVINVPLFREDCQLVAFDKPDDYREMYYTFVIRHKNYTQVDRLINVQWSGHWVSVGGLSYLYDKQTGDRYMINSVFEGYPMDKTLVLRDMKGCTVVITQIYPPLDKGVDVVDHIVVKSPDAVFPSNSMSASLENLKVYDSVDDLPYKSISKRDSRVITLDDNFEMSDKESEKLYR